MICGIVGVVMALGTNRWVTRPARAFVVTTTVLTAVSLVTPLSAENASTATLRSKSHVEGSRERSPRRQFRLP